MLSKEEKMGSSYGLHWSRYVTDGRSEQIQRERQLAKSDRCNSYFKVNLMMIIYIKKKHCFDKTVRFYTKYIVCGLLPVHYFQ